MVERHHSVRAGRDHIQSDTLRFYPSNEECPTESMPNVVLLSSVMQYLSNVDDLIERINDTRARILIIDRLPFHRGVIDKIRIQTVPERIYHASYPMRVFSCLNFLIGRSLKRPRALRDRWFQAVGLKYSFKVLF